MYKRDTPNIPGVNAYIQYQWDKTMKVQLVSEGQFVQLFTNCRRNNHGPSRPAMPERQINKTQAAYADSTGGSASSRSYGFEGLHHDSATEQALHR